MEEDIESFIDRILEKMFNELDKYQLKFSPEVRERFKRDLINSNKSKKEILEFVVKIINGVIYRQKAKEAIKSGEISGNFDLILSVIEDLFSDEVLSSRMTIYGGTIPYLVTKQQPERIIEDIDTLVSLKDMQQVREIVLANPNKFKIVRDTLQVTDNEHGFDMIVDNSVMVSVFPTVVDERGMVIRNFYYDNLKDRIIVAATLFPGIHMSEEMETIDVNGCPVRIMSPEFTYITKSDAKRNKDVEDLQVLEQVIKPEKVELMRRKLRSTPRDKAKSIKKDVNAEEIGKE